MTTQGTPIKQKKEHQCYPQCSVPANITNNAMCIKCYPQCLMGLRCTNVNQCKQLFEVSEQNGCKVLHWTQQLCVMLYINVLLLWYHDIKTIYMLLCLILYFVVYKKSVLGKTFTAYIQFSLQYLREIYNRTHTYNFQ